MRNTLNRPVNNYQRRQSERAAREAEDQRILDAWVRGEDVFGSHASGNPFSVGPFSTGSFSHDSHGKLIEGILVSKEDDNG